VTPPASPLWGDHHEHPGCSGCQTCLACVLDDAPCAGCTSLAAALEVAPRSRRGDGCGELFHDYSPDPHR
jgi:hypothetical protein